VRQTRASTTTIARGQSETEMASEAKSTSDDDFPNIHESLRTYAWLKKLWAMSAMSQQLPTARPGGVQLTIAHN
jgi:hypothetical protein